MRIGVIARADNRGLGIQTWEVARHLEVERVLVVREPGSERRGFHPQLDRFPGAAIVEFGQYNDGELDEEICRGWLDGLDVIYSAETLYDWRISGWAREAGCATVVHANPEFYKHSVDSLDHPTAWWSATPWRLGFLPRETRVVPMPCPTDRWEGLEAAPLEEELRVLHVVGRQAARDRNGTAIVVDCLRQLRGRVHVTITKQEANRLTLKSRIAQQRCDVIAGPEDYWKLYEGFHVLAMPRRYGGLCLPVIEAIGAGLVPILPNASPNEQWPGFLLPTKRTSRTMRTPAGNVPMTDVRPADLARVLNGIMESPERFEQLRVEGRSWRFRNSWDALRPLWLEELARAASAAKAAR